MNHFKKLWILGLFVILVVFLFAVNRRIVSNHNDRLRHAEKIVFCINEYYYENNKMPSSLKEIEDRIYSLALPFEGNLTLESNGNSTVLREKESRFVNLIQKKAINLEVYPKQENLEK